MKKFIIIACVLGFFATSVAFAAVKVQEIKSWDFMAQIVTNSGNLFIYKVVDDKNTCYVMTNDFSVNSRTNGANFGISCVK